MDFYTFSIGADAMADGGHLSKAAMLVVVDSNGEWQWIFVNCSNDRWVSLTRRSQR